MRAALITISILLLFGGGAAVAAFAASGGKPPYTEEQAADLARTVDAAIAAERSAVKAIGRHRIITALSGATEGRNELSRAANSLATHDHSDDPNVGNQAEEAIGLDGEAMKDLDAAKTSKDASVQERLLDSAKKALTQALALKKKVFVYFDTYTPPATTTTTPPPATAGPLSVCVFVTNNGSTSTENVHIRDPGAGGWGGTVTFNGQGLSQTNHITIGSDGSVITPFTVSTFGMATIMTSINTPSGTPQTNTTTFTLDTDNDKTTSDCP